MQKAMFILMLEGSLEYPSILFRGEGRDAKHANFKLPRLFFSKHRFRLSLALWSGETTCMESLSQLAHLFVRPHKAAILSFTALGSSVEGFLVFMV